MLKSWLKDFCIAMLNRIEGKMTPRNACDARESEFYRVSATRVAQQLFQDCGGYIYAGPFAGMRVPNISPYSLNPSLLLGCYEAELHDPIVYLMGKQIKQVVNIGAAEGYYAVGLARLFPGVPVVAFESNPYMQDVLSAASSLNNVEKQVNIQGFCTEEAFDRALLQDALVLCDVEGAEKILLDPLRNPTLKSAFVLCELHDFLDNEITPTLIERFRTTHRIDMKLQRFHDPRDYPIIDRYSSFDQWIATHENRHVGDVVCSGRYLVCEPLG